MSPGAAAHFSTYSDAQTVTVGSHVATLVPRPSPLFENEPTRFYAYFASGRDRPPPTNYSAALELLVDGSVAWATFETSPEVRSVPVRLPGPGNYTGRFWLHTARENVSGPVAFNVYRDFGFRIVPENADLDPRADEPVRVAFRTVEPNGDQGVDAVEDLRVRAEHWSDDHVTFLGSLELPLRRGATVGTWEAEHTFAHAGMWHLWFASGSADMPPYSYPMWHVTALEARAEAGSTPAPTLVFGAAAIVVAVVVVARRGS